MTRTRPSRLSGVVLLAWWASEAAAQAAPSPSRSPQQLYLAATAAAEASLRLHETDRVKHWLEIAPEPLRGWEWRYLTAKADRSSSALSMDQGTISDVAMSPDGRVLAVAGADGRTRLVDAASGTVVRDLTGHTAAVWSPRFSSDGLRLATVSSDGSARIWEVATGKELHVLPKNGQGVAAVAWSPDDSHVAVCSWDWTRERGVWGAINVWNARTGERTHQMEHGVKPVASIGYTPDGSRLVVGTWDFDLTVYETGSWRKVHELRPPESEDYQALYGFVISQDGRRAAAAYADQRVRVWDLVEGTLLGTLSAPAEGLLQAINDVTFLPGGDRLATAGADLTVRLWDLGSGKALATLHGHDRAVNSVAAAPDGRTLYSGSADGTVRTWDLEREAAERTTWPLPHPAYSLSFDPEQGQAVAATWQGWIRIFETGTGREVRAWQGHEESGVGAAWSPDGRWIATTGNDGRVVLWDASTGALVKELVDRRGQILSVAFSPDGSLVAAPGPGGTVDVWRVPSGEPFAQLGGATEATVGYVAWNPGGGSVAAGSSDGLVRIWDVQSESLRHRLDLGIRGTVALAYSPTGERLVAGAGRSVKVWDARDGQEVGNFPSPLATVLTLAVSPDGRRIAAGLGGNTFEVWDAATGDVMLRLPQKATAWFVTWTRSHDLFLIPLDETIRVLRAQPPVADSATRVGGAHTDSTWTEHLAFLSRGSGTWLTANAEYQTEQNGEPDTYAMRYWSGFGGTTQHGCLWGVSPGRQPVVSWHFFTAWDPAQEAFLVQQSGSTGIVGIGYESPKTGVAEQRFTAPDGTAWEIRHISTPTPPDTLLTRSFRREAGGDWRPARTYRWVRQPPGTPAPC